MTSISSIILRKILVRVLEIEYLHLLSEISHENTPPPPANLLDDEDELMVVYSIFKSLDLVKKNELSELIKTLVELIEQSRSNNPEMIERKLL